MQDSMDDEISDGVMSSNVQSTALYAASRFFTSPPHQDVLNVLRQISTTIPSNQGDICSLCTIIFGPLNSGRSSMLMHLAFLHMLESSSNKVLILRLSEVSLPSHIHVQGRNDRHVQALKGITVRYIKDGLALNRSILSLDKSQFSLVLIDDLSHIVCQSIKHTQLIHNLARTLGLLHDAVHVQLERKKSCRICVFDRFTPDLVRHSQQQYGIWKLFCRYFQDYIVLEPMQSIQGILSFKLHCCIKQWKTLSDISTSFCNDNEITVDEQDDIIRFEYQIRKVKTLPESINTSGLLDEANYIYLTNVV